MPSGTWSPSESCGQPCTSTVAPFGVRGQVSRPSYTPSPSASVGQPFTSTLAPAGVFGHLSFLSGTPSPSVSLGLPPQPYVRPPQYCWSDLFAVDQFSCGTLSRFLASSRSETCCESGMRRPSAASNVPKCRSSTPAAFVSYRL